MAPGARPLLLWPASPVEGVCGEPAGAVPVVAVAEGGTAAFEPGPPLLPAAGSAVVAGGVLVSVLVPLVAVLSSAKAAEETANAAASVSVRIDVLIFISVCSVFEL